MLDFMAELYQLAERQHGVVATHQARPFATTSQLRREFASNRWRRCAPGVFRAAGAPAGPYALVMVALLRAGPGAVVSHQSALALFGLPGPKLTPVHTTRMRGSNGVKVRGDGIVPHESRRLPPHHITVHDGFPTVTPSRALADASRTEGIGRLERWLDWLWVRRLVSATSVTEVLGDLWNRGRPELKKLAHVMRDRGSDYIAPASGLESRLNSVLDAAELPGVRRQVDLGGKEWLARVDFKIDGVPLVIEVQSDTYHASLSAQRDDEARFEALSSAGFRAVPLWESEVWYEPETVVDTIRLAMAELRA